MRAILMKLFMLLLWSCLSLGSPFQDTPPTANEWRLALPIGNTPDGDLSVGACGCANDQGDMVVYSNNSLWFYLPQQNAWSAFYRPWLEGYTVPPTRLHATINFAPVLNQGYSSYILFGGVDPLGNYLNDVWIFDPVILSWSQFFFPLGVPFPASRARHTTTVVSSSGFNNSTSANSTNNIYLVIFGGTTASRTFNDTWVLELGSMTFTKLNTSQNVPLSRCGHSAEMLSSSELLMTGGCSLLKKGSSSINKCTSFQQANDTWILTLTFSYEGSTVVPTGTWALVEGTNTTGTYFSAIARFSSTNLGNCLLLSGGITFIGELSNILWSFCQLSPQWTQVILSQESSAPIAAYNQIAIYSNIRQSILFFGGSNTIYNLNTISEFSPMTVKFRGRRPNVYPLDRVSPAVVSLPDLVVLFGGQSVATSAALADTWVYDVDASTWTEVFPADTPSPRFDTSFTSYNSSQVILYGGRTQASDVLDNGVWELRAFQDPPTLISSGAWNWFLHTPSTSAFPQPRIGAPIVTYGSLMVMFGGEYFDTNTEEPAYLQETWTFDLEQNVWQDMSFQSTPPSARSNHAFFLLSSQNIAYIYGGISDEGVLSDSWLLNLSTWAWTQVLHIKVPPPPLYSSQFVRISDYKVVIYGGSSTNDTWSVQLWVGNILNGSVSWEQYPYNGDSPKTIGSRLVALPPDDESNFWPQLQFIGDYGDDDSYVMPYMFLGCPSGSSSTNFSFIRCELCPIGTFADGTGKYKCTSCVGRASTKSIGSKKSAECDVCKPDTCLHGASCTISRHSDFKCSCTFGYGGTTCSLNWLAIVLGCGFGFGVLALLGFVAWRKSSKWKKYSMLQEQLLDRSQNELQQVKRAWEISSTEITLRECIAQGAYGTVFRGEWNELHVAVKLLKESIDPRAVDLFQEEIKTMQTIRHPNIVLFFGGGVWSQPPYEGTPFLMTEFLRYGSLRAILDNEAIDLDFPKKVRFAIDVAEGMNFLHSLFPPIVHRDLKSLNILVSEKWVCKVGDFGTSRLYEQMLERRQSIKGLTDRFKNFVRRSTISASVEPPYNASTSSSAHLRDGKSMLTTDVGSPCWAAPEVLEGNSYNLSCDVYSFGIVLWELLTRQVPFMECKRVIQIIDLVRGGHRPFIPLDTDMIYSNLIRQCWDHEPSRRPSFATILVTLRSLALET